MMDPIISNKQAYLPKDYVPASSDVVCGRGKANARLEGNQRFINIVRRNLGRYAAARKRIDKSIVVISVVQQVVTDCGSKFIRYDSKAQRYFELSEDQVHEKTGHAIRDLLKNKKQKDVLNIKTNQRVDRRRKRSLLETKPDVSTSCSQLEADAMKSPNSILTAALEISDSLLSSEPLLNSTDGECECRGIETPTLVKSFDDCPISETYRERLTNGLVAGSFNEESRLLLRSLLPGYKPEKTEDSHEISNLLQAGRFMCVGNPLNQDDLLLDDLFEDL